MNDKLRLKETTKEERAVFPINSGDEKKLTFAYFCENHENPI